MRAVSALVAAIAGVDAGACNPARPTVRVDYSQERLAQFSDTLPNP